jgi:hypothetical protein
VLRKNTPAGRRCTLGSFCTSFITVAQRAAVELGGEGDVALALVAVDLRGAAAVLDARHRRQRHRRAVRAGHAQRRQQDGIFQRAAGEADADGICRSARFNFASACR